MPVKKYKAKGKRGRVFSIQFTKHDSIPYQSFSLQDSDQVFSYFGGTDISLIPEGTDMEFQYEMRGKYANVREIDGFDHLPKLDKKALKEDYLKEKGGEQNQESYQDHRSVKVETQNELDSRPPEQIEYEKPFVRVPGQDRDDDRNWVSKEMELKIKMNAGNTVKTILELACNASAYSEDGSMNEVSFWKYYEILMDAYDRGVGRISGISLGYDTNTDEKESADKETGQQEQPEENQQTD